jgi:hypothetical protein
MFAYIVLFGDCIPTRWQDEDECRVVIFIRGNFTMSAFAECIVPMATAQAFAMPCRGELNFYSWTGPVARLVVLTFLLVVLEANTEVSTVLDC